MIKNETYLKIFELKREADRVWIYQRGNTEKLGMAFPKLTYKQELPVGIC